MHNPPHSRITTLLVLLLPLIAAPSLRAQVTTDTLRLSLQEAVQVALAKGRTVKIAEMEVQKKVYDKQAAIAKLYPSVDLTGDYGYTLKKQVMYLGDIKIPGMPESATNKGIEVGRTYQVSGGMTVGMPIVNAQAWMAIRLSKEAVELALKQAEESEINLYNQVVKAYYAILLAQESARVIAQSHDNARASYEMIAHRYDLGMVAEFDKIRADVAVKNLEPQLQQALNSVVAAKNQLKILLSLDIDRPIECPDTLRDREESMYRSYFEPLVALGKNSQMAQIDTQIKMLRTQQSMAKAAFVPTLSLGGFYKYGAMDDAFSWKDYQWTPFSVVQLTLSIPLFRGMDRIVTLKKARTSLKQAELQREQLESTLRAEAQRSGDNMKASLKKAASAKQAILQAEKGYEIAKKRYELGSSTLVELNDANLALAQARLNYLQALYDFVSNEADLKKLYGEMPRVR